MSYDVKKKCMTSKFHSPSLHAAMLKNAQRSYLQWSSLSGRGKNQIIIPQHSFTVLKVKARFQIQYAICSFKKIAGPPYLILGCLDGCSCVAWSFFPTTILSSFSHFFLLVIVTYIYIHIYSVIVPLNIHEMTCMVNGVHSLTHTSTLIQIDLIYQDSLFTF